MTKQITMTREIDNKIFEPPAGINFRSFDYVPLTDLSTHLCKVAVFLQDVDPYEKLIKYDDWWEHDGLHFQKGLIDFHNLFSVIKSPRELFENMQGDYMVFMGISPIDSK